SGSPLFVSGSSPLREDAWRTASQSINRRETRALRTDSAHEPYVLAWAPIANTGAGLVYVWRWNDLDPHGGSRARGLLIATAIMALFGMAVGVLLARHITRPILSLAADVGHARASRERISAGSGGDEVAALRLAFAELVDELASREAQVREDRDRIAEL